MIDCDELIEQLHAQACDQIQLACMAKATDVAAMHLDLAELTESQAHAAKQLCTER